MHIIQVSSRFPVRESGICSSEFSIGETLVEATDDE